ncbi:MAG: LysR family transcriptional regulator, partial [Methylophilus sp.]
MQNKLEIMRIFKVAAESLNFKEAAVRLGVSPQSVTRAIKELEEILGEPLFYRSTRNTSITDFGKQIALKNEAIIEQIDTLLRPHKSNDMDTVDGLVR